MNELSSDESKKTYREFIKANTLLMSEDFSQCPFQPPRALHNAGLSDANTRFRVFVDERLDRKSILKVNRTEKMASLNIHHDGKRTSSKKGKSKQE